MYSSLNLTGQGGGYSDISPQGTIYNIYRGSFILGTVTASPFFFPIDDERDDVFHFPQLDDPRIGWKTLSLQLVQICYSTSLPMNTRSCDIIISQPPTENVYLSSTTSFTWLDLYNPLMVYPNPPPSGLYDMYPLDWEGCIRWENSGDFYFKVKRSGGSSAELRSIIKGIYTLY